MTRQTLRAHVRSWPKCEVPTGSENVCCWGQTGPKADIAKSTRLTRSGPWLHLEATGKADIGPCCRFCARLRSKPLLLPTAPWTSHDVFEMRARKSHRGEVLRGVRCALGLDMRQLRSPAFPDRQVLLGVR